MNIVAEDNGVPQKNAAAQLRITIIRYPGAPIVGPASCVASLSENTPLGPIASTRLTVTDAFQLVSRQSFHLFDEMDKENLDI